MSRAAAANLYVRRALRSCRGLMYHSAHPLKTFPDGFAPTFCRIFSCNRDSCAAVFHFAATRPGLVSPDAASETYKLEEGDSEPDEKVFPTLNRHAPRVRAGGRADAAGRRDGRGGAARAPASRRRGDGR